MICQACGVEAPTKHVVFYQNIGALVVHFHKSINGELCKSCIHKYFWQFTLTNLTLGWWGVKSFFLTIFYTGNNIIHYVRALSLEPVPAGATPPKLTDGAVYRLQPYTTEIDARLTGGENLNEVAKSIASRAGVTHAQVILYAAMLANRGDDLRLDLQLEFREAVLGDEKEIRILHFEGCEVCHNSGQRTNYTGVQSSPCNICGGSGRLEVVKKLKIVIPAGVDHGTRLRIAGEGDVGICGGLPGDLYIYLFINENPEFRRDGINILSDVTISQQQAVLGCQLPVNTVDGSVDLSVPPGTKANSVLRLKNKGVPELGNPGNRGDHLITIKVL